MNQSTPNEEKAYEGTKHLTDSEYHELLSVEQRRTILDILANSTSPVELRDLAATIVAQETDVVGVADATEERVALRLHHVHLPMMDELGVIDYNSTTSRVVSCP